MLIGISMAIYAYTWLLDTGVIPVHILFKPFYNYGIFAVIGFATLLASPPAIWVAYSYHKLKKGKANFTNVKIKEWKFFIKQILLTCAVFAGAVIAFAKGYQMHEAEYDKVLMKLDRKVCIDNPDPFTTIQEMAANQWVDKVTQVSYFKESHALLITITSKGDNFGEKYIQLKRDQINEEVFELCKKLKLHIE